ncbi:MAG TPA: glycoside hydrolase family 88 protein [Chitinophagaceae bacterium]|nr:glycoside hydrolase family 88 protein [Chitinophagaceae bacterium]
MKLIVTIACLIIATFAYAQTRVKPSVKALPSGKASRNWSQELAATAMYIWKDSFALRPGQPAKWSYDQGVILKGIEGIWNATGNGEYFRYIQKCMDFYVQEDGSIKGYRPDEYNIDHINNGKLLLLLYRVTGKEKYKKATDLLRGQLRSHPRTSEGGFWHKKIYPYQMWLDGLYMGQPFYAEYAMLFHEDTAFNDITRQFVLMERHARDAKTGLLYHGWDESRQQRWADKTTGLSPNVWGRAMGWFGMAMVDVLDYFPANHPGRDSIIGILNRYAKGIAAYQDPKTGLWYDVVDKQKTPKNYREASASCMITYTLAKGVRKGYLPASYLQTANKAYGGIVKEFIETDSEGRTNLKGTVAVSGLGGNPYRDGSFEYYMSEPVIVNDPKGMGAFIKCAVEMEMLPKQSIGKGKNIVLDTYFNNEWKKDATGANVRYHYTWDDKTNSGFAMLGDIFRIHGANTTSLETAPDAENLRKADVYIIVDPDTKKETADPHFIQPQHTSAIADWVKAGGVLVLMGNDMNNAEFEHFNQLAARFGIQFNTDNFHQVINNQYEQGAFDISNNAVFKNTKKIFIKELATLRINKPAEPILTDNGHVIMAAAKYGKGLVFAIGDPWLYNEYVDGRRLPADYDNYKAGEGLVKWLLAMSRKK